MAKTLLNGLNDVLKKVGVLDNDTVLASLSDPARQTYIDTAVQALNETIDRLYALPQMPTRPSQVGEATITLATGDQDYALNASLVRLLPRFGLVDETNNHIIEIDGDPDAYRNLILADTEQDDTGLPTIACIRPTDGQLWLDRAPTAAYNGRVYNYRYEKNLGMSVYSETFPFSDPVYRGVVLAASEIWKRENKNSFSEGFFNSALAQAANRLTMIPERDTWLDKGHGSGSNPTDPFES